MPTTTYLISGASRGLGYETAKQLLAQNPDNRVIAAVRDPSKAAQINELVKQYPGAIDVVTLDVADPASIKAGMEAVAESKLAENGIDVLVNNAGLAMDPQNSRPVDEAFEEHLNVNVYGPIRLTQAALPLLRQGREKKVITTSSTMGSVASSFGYPPLAIAYSMSKATINMYFAKIAQEYRSEGITCILQCPGYVKTDMNGGDSGPAYLTPQESVAGSLKNVFSKGFEDTGKFYNHDGKLVPW